MIEVIDEQLPVLGNNDKTNKVPQVLLKLNKLDLIEFLPYILTFRFVVESVFHLKVMSNKIAKKTIRIKNSAIVFHKSTFKDINRLVGSSILSIPTHSEEGCGVNVVQADLFLAMPNIWKHLLPTLNGSVKASICESVNAPMTALKVDWKYFLSLINEGKYMFPKPSVHDRSSSNSREDLKLFLSISLVVLDLVDS